MTKECFILLSKNRLSRKKNISRQRYKIVLGQRRQLNDRIESFSVTGNNTKGTITDLSTKVTQVNKGTDCSVFEGHERNT